MVKKINFASMIMLALLITPALLGVTSKQKDDFESGSTQGWTTGSQNSNPPVNIATGGPDGANDNYLRMTSTGGFGAGSKLVSFNISQWKGNYTAAGIASIKMDVRNFGTSNLVLRLALKGTSSYISSVSGINLPAGSGWQTVTFPVTVSDMAGSSVSVILANVTEVRLLHSTTPDYQGDPVVATLGVDNIFAEPVAPPPPQPDITWVFSSVQDSNNNNLFAYQLTGFSPAEADRSTLPATSSVESRLSTGLGVIGSLNPTIPLVIGKRYAVTILNSQIHPFEVIAKGDTDVNDIPLLSQGFVASSLENDSNVIWLDEADTVTFTLTEELADAMAANDVPGYRCRIHSDSERGNFAISGPPIDELIGLSPVTINLKTVASGLTSPVAMVSDPAGLDKLYIVDQSGHVNIIEQGQLLEDVFLDVNNLLISPLGIIGSHDVNDYDERGFLGMAFHPDFTDPNLPGYHRLYTYTSEPVNGIADFTIDMPVDQVNHQSVIREWQLDPGTGLADPNSSRVIMRIDQPQFNHNAGHLEFGPDGYMYIALGDGGGANDTSPGHGTTGNGQNINRVHGKILRIDPLDPVLTPGSADLMSANGSYRVPQDNPFVGIDGVDEIYAYGFRNPYRFSFDKESGILIVADVGQLLVEEINIVNKGKNYGWNRKEGTFKFDPANVNTGLPLDDPNFTDPVAQYDHDDGLSIIGGHSYYGTEVPELWGSYVFGDFSRGFFSPDGRLLTADLFTGKIQELLIGADKHSLGMFVKGIGRDNSGDVYVLASTALGPYGDTGVVMKIVSPNPRFEAELLPVDTDMNFPSMGQSFFELSSDGSSMLIPGKSRGILGEGSFTELNFVGPLAGMTINDLLTAVQENRAYVNVHTQQYPAGEIRGLMN